MTTIVSVERWAAGCEKCQEYATHFARVAENQHTYNLPCGCGYRSSLGDPTVPLTPLTPAEIAAGILMIDDDTDTFVNVHTGGKSWP